MDKNSNLYVFLFAATMTLIIAVALSSVSEGLRPIKEKNELVYKKKEILGCVISADEIKAMNDSTVEATFRNKIVQLVINSEGREVQLETEALLIDMKKEKSKPVEQRNLPLFVYKGDDSKKQYIIPVRGNGLWDAIWGFVAVKDDINTISGISFGHAGETPGLGAEIKDNARWRNSFIGKKLYNSNGEYVSVSVKKGTITDPEHQVDGISGATITADGVSSMMYNDIKNYLPYLKSLKEI